MEGSMEKMAAALVWPGCWPSLSEEVVSELDKEDTGIWSAKSIPSRVVSMCKGPVTGPLLPCSGQEGHHRGQSRGMN